MSIESMIEATIGKEGRYSNHPSDTGGETMWGITARTARKHGYTGAMRDLPRSTAVAIYRQEYAINSGFAAVAEVSPLVGEVLFDTGVNMGPAVPAYWFQEWLNVFNSQGRLYSDINEDGDVGPATIKAFRQYLKARGKEGEVIMARALNCSRGERYKSLGRHRMANEDFVYGWMKRVSI